MKTINDIYSKETRYPEKVLQFGEGNFLRAFADYLIDIMNEKCVFGGSVVLCQPIENGLCDMINEQDGIYTLILRGRENSQPVEKSRVIKSVSRCINPYRDFEALLEIARSEDLKVIISNTTEAGIVFNPDDKFNDTPASSYPGKLTRFLYERFTHFNGNADAALLILPVELIDNNGDELCKCVLQFADLWNLGDEFKSWLSKCTFSNTLVDRIVTGFPKNEAGTFFDKLGYTDNLLDTAEPFFFWALEVPEDKRNIFPADKSGLNAIFADSIKNYKMRKVRILNGAHTASVLGAYLSGYDIVRDMMNDSEFNSFISQTLKEEVIPYIPLPEKELSDFASAVFERFNNPFIDHRLLDISLNSVSKYKARCLPSVLDALKAGNFPKHLLFSLACLLKFYKGYEKDGGFYSVRNGEEYQIKDSADVIKAFSSAISGDNYVKTIMSNADLWGLDLTTLDDAFEFVNECFNAAESKSVKEAMELLK